MVAMEALKAMKKAKAAMKKAKATTKKAKHVVEARKTNALYTVDNQYIYIFQKSF